MGKIKLNSGTEIAFQTSGKHHFFGYYDKCPWSRDGRFLLAHETDFIDRLPNGNDIAWIGFFDLKSNGSFKKLAETKAWNWQQGSMLQWLGPDFNKRIIFNDLRKGRFVSVILNIETGQEEKEIPFPVYAVHPNGKSALSLDFSRLDNLREGYGYKGLKNNSSDDKDGVFSIDLDSGKIDLALSFARLQKNQPISSMKEGRHWVDHLEFSPDGKKTAFIHRWELNDGGMHSRFCVANFEEGGLDLPVVLLDSGKASHLAWKDNNEVLIWGRPKSVIAKIGKNTLIRKIFIPFYRALSRSSGLRRKLAGEAILSFRFSKGEISNYTESLVAEKFIKEDVHFSFSPNKKWLISDTYPDDGHSRSLNLFDVLGDRFINIGYFYSLPRGVKEDWDLSALRCDLHPRWSREGKQICIDSVHDGSRQIYLLDVKKLIEHEA